jgi:excisionase family DNA binding protein
MSAMKKESKPVSPEAVLLSYAETSARLGFGRHQIRKLRQAGLLETVKLGRHVRFVAESVKTLPQRMRQSAPIA